MKDAANLIDALTALAWPLIAGLALWRLFPVVKEVLRSRGFTVKVGAAELTVQEISDQLLRTTADMQGKLASVTPSPLALESLPGRTLRSVLWVDDTPRNNAYEAAQLRALGVSVVQVSSTREAVTALSSATPPFDALISDLARTEDGTLHPTAGLDLTRELRARGERVPVFVYTSRPGSAREGDILAAGANGVATAPTELFELLHEVGGFPREQGAGTPA
ncbi:response regulator [Streptomyces sp. NPDC012746]|uniref:response regulator n=1 Tax=Streptomyces sp. NPDC012746 TaxID=3364845 RepID=UPI00369F5BB9